jgi:hypothetical protein
MAAPLQLARKTTSKYGKTGYRLRQRGHTRGCRAWKVLSIVASRGIHGVWLMSAVG